MKKEMFDSMYMLDLTGKVEKDYKGLNYISWANAYKLAMEQDPNFTFEVLEDADGFPLFSRGTCHMVKTTVTMFGETKKMFLPVMDNRHNAVAEPNTRQISDSIMRCLVKNIALFGIGLSLYTGEDLEQFKSPEQLMKEAEDKLKADDMPTPKDRKIFIDVLKSKHSNEEILKACKDTEIDPDTATMSELKYLRQILWNSKKVS